MEDEKEKIVFSLSELDSISEKIFKKFECLPTLSELKALVKINKEFFPGISIGNLYNSVARINGFNDWNDFRLVLEDDMESFNNLKREEVIKKKKYIEANLTNINAVNRAKGMVMGEFNILKLFRIRSGIFVYTKDIPSGFIPQIMLEEKYRDLLFPKNSILQLLPHPLNNNLLLLRFYSDDLIGPGNKKLIEPKNIHMNSIEISKDMVFPDKLLSILKIPDSIKQYESSFTIPTVEYNPEELFHNIGKIYQGGIYGLGK